MIPKIENILLFSTLIFILFRVKYKLKRIKSSENLDLLDDNCDIKICKKIDLTPSELAIYNEEESSQSIKTISTDLSEDDYDCEIISD